MRDSGCGGRVKEKQMEQMRKMEVDGEEWVGRMGK